MKTSLILASASLSLLAAAPAFCQNVGISAAVNQAARGTQPGASVRTIVLGANVVHNERIETDGVGLLQILLADGTTFTIGPNSALSIDRFVYDPNAGTAEVSATLTKGVFRFIGGKTSKTPGGVSLDTPVGTIGIRGAMADIEVGGTESHFDLKFGKELTLDNPDGTRQRVYEPGYSIVVTRNADGSQTRKIVRTPPGSASKIQDALSGAPGTNGGSDEQPTDRIVVVSGIATENSDRPPFANDPPVPTARPSDGDETRVEEEIVREASIDTIRNEVAQERAAVEESVVVPTPRPVEPEPAPNALAFGVLTAGTTYEVFDGEIITNPGAIGLVGGSPETDFTANLTQAQGSGFAVGTTPQGLLVLPVFSDDRFTSHLVTAGDGASLGGVSLSGIVYSGPDGFSAYELGLDGDRTRPVYAAVGTATPDISVLMDGDVRTYTYTPDFIQGLPVPYMRNGALDADFAAAARTPFYLLEAAAPGSGTRSKLFESWLLIDGDGPAQKSGIGVNVAELFDANGVYGSNASRRGSYRNDSTATAYSTVGGAVSLAPSGRTTDFFGSNAQNLILGHDIGTNDVFNDSPSDRSGGTPIGSLHVLALTDERPLAEFTTGAAATRQLGTVPNTTIFGFSAAVDEGIRTDGSTFFLPVTSGANTSNTALQFNGETNSVGGEIEVGNPRFTLQVAFGDGIGGNASGGRSIYLNDDTFAASQNRNLDRTVTRNIDAQGNVTANFATVPDDTPKTYLVSGDALPQPNLLPGGQMCACKFLEWGWWGTQVRSEQTPGAGVEGFRQGIHLGTWVAGDVADAADLSTLAGTTATYQGNALANVLTNNGTSFGNYVASGDMSMDWDFSAAGGSMAIGNLDGRNFAGGLSQTGSGGSAGFAGTLTQTGTTTGAAGPINGAFVNDGVDIAEGVIGNLNLSTPSRDWTAVGIIAGARQPGL